MSMDRPVYAQKRKHAAYTRRVYRIPRNGHMLLFLMRIAWMMFSCPDTGSAGHPARPLVSRLLRAEWRRPAARRQSRSPASTTGSVMGRSDDRAQ